MFGPKPDDPRVQKLLDRLEEVSGQLAEVRGTLDGQKEALRLTKQVTTLREEISTLEVSKSKLTEQHEREKREVEHMVGLQRKRGEFETTSARREAVLEVREENLSAQQDQFEAQMKFREERFDGEVEYLKSLMGQILKRLPTIGVELDGGAKPSVSKDK